MAKVKRKDSVDGFPEKYAKILDKTWMEEVDGFDEEKLRSVVIDANGSISEQEKLRDADDKLKAAKDLVKDLGGAYKDSIKYQSAKIKYAIFNLEKMGKM